MAAVEVAAVEESKTAMALMLSSWFIGCCCCEAAGSGLSGVGQPLIGS